MDANGFHRPRGERRLRAIVMHHELPFAGSDRDVVGLVGADDRQHIARERGEDFYHQRFQNVIEYDLSLPVATRDA